MDTNGLSLDKAELLSVLLEALLYGCSLSMFVETLRTLLSRRSTRTLNYRMLTAACALLSCSTAHMVVDIVRIMEGLIIYRDNYPGGPIAYFANVAQWTFVAKNYMFTVQTLLGDGVVLYRCYAVWQSKSIMIVPVLLWCATAVTGIGSPYTASRVKQNRVFGGSLSHWITSYWVAALLTNFLTTLLLIGRIWYLDRKATRLCGNKEARLRPVLQILIDAGAIYSLTLIVALICFLSESNVQYIILNMVTPIISITFYMVIVRIGLTNGGDRTMNNISALTFASIDDRATTQEGTHRMKVRITTLTENQVDDDQYRKTCPSRHVGSKTSLSKIEDDVEGDAV